MKTRPIIFDAYTKVKNTVHSCNTQIHINGAKQLIKNFVNLYFSDRRTTEYAESLIILLNIKQNYIQSLNKNTI